MGVDLGDISRYLLIGAGGVGILVLVERGELAETYDVAGNTVQTTNIGFGAIAFAALICVLAYSFWIRSQL